MKTERAGNMNKDKFCVLIAESNEQIAALLKTEADWRGWCYEVVESAERLLSRLNETLYAEFSFDLIITDICFQPVGLVLDGLTALREIRKLFPNLPVVFFSSKMEALAITEAMKMDATVCPTKQEIMANAGNISNFFDRIEAIGHFRPLKSDNWTGAERRKQNIPPLNRHRRAGDEKVVAAAAMQAEMPSARPKLEYPKPLLWVQRKIMARREA